MPAALYPTVIDVLQWAANRFGNQLLDYAAKDAWSALKRMLVQAALAEAERRRESRPLETETEVWEITREEFQRELMRLNTKDVDARVREFADLYLN